MRDAGCESKQPATRILHLASRIKHPATMPKFDHHFFVCTNTRPPIAKPSCGASTGHELFACFQELIAKNGWQEKVAVNATSCLGPCESGPVVVIYPAGVWYAGVQPDDAEELLQNHVIQGKKVRRLVMRESREK